MHARVPPRCPAAPTSAAEDAPSVRCLCTLSPLVFLSSSAHSMLHPWCCHLGHSHFLSQLLSLPSQCLATAFLELVVSSKSRGRCLYSSAPWTFSCLSCIAHWPSPHHVLFSHRFPACSGMRPPRSLCSFDRAGSPLAQSLARSILLALFFTIPPATGPPVFHHQLQQTSELSPPPPSPEPRFLIFAAFLP